MVLFYEREDVTELSLTQLLATVTILAIGQNTIEISIKTFTHGNCRPLDSH